MEHQGLAEILEAIDGGDCEGARRSLRTYLVDAHDAPTHELCYVMGRAWFDEDKPTARYFFESALALQPDFAEAGAYEARCGSALEDLEDFHDDSHPACATCTYHYREGALACPYCGSATLPPRQETDDSLEGQLRAAGQEVVDSIRTFSERDDVQRAKEKALETGQHAVKKARELAESDKAKELKGKAEELGHRTMAKAKEISENKKVKEATERASALGKEAADKARAFGERDDVKEALHRTQETTSGFLKKLQEYLSAEQKRINEAQGNEKALLIGKWVAIIFVVLLLLRWLFGG